MYEEKLLVGVATGCSVIAIAACLVVLPQLYAEINAIQDEVLDSVSIFRVETDTAWTELLDVQVTVTPPSRPKMNPTEDYHHSASANRPDQLVHQDPQEL